MACFRQFSLSLDDDDIAGNKVTLLSVVVCKIGKARELRKKQWDNGTMDLRGKGQPYGHGHALQLLLRDAANYLS